MLSSLHFQHELASHPLLVFFFFCLLWNVVKLCKESLDEVNAVRKRRILLQLDPASSVLIDAE